MFYSYLRILHEVIRERKMQVHEDHFTNTKKAESTSKSTPASAERHKRDTGASHLREGTTPKV